MEKPKLSIIMPVYNARDIKSNVNEAINELNKLGVSYEIILSNDGSTNSCFEEAKKIKDPHLKVVGYEKNQGKGNAIKYGFRFTKGEYVAFVDSGRDINPKQIGDFIKTLEEILEAMPDANVVVAKELTKMFEHIYRGKVEDVLEEVRKDGARGEYTLIISNDEFRILNK